MKLATGILAFTVLFAGNAYAGGNPDEDQSGAMTRDPLPQAEPASLDTQAIIKDMIEAEVFAEPQIPEGFLRAEKMDEAVTTVPVTIARAEPRAECAFVFEWLAEQMGGECFRDSNFHNPSPVGFTTIYGTKTVEVEKTDRFHKNFGKGYKAKKRAIRKAHRLAKRGYKVRVGYKHGWRVKAKKTYTEEVEVPTVTRIRNDNAGSSDGGRAGDSNFGDRERDFGPGRGNK